MFTEIQSLFQQNLKLDQIGLIPLKQPLTIAFYKKWLNKNYYGSMNYLKAHLDLKEYPEKLNAEFKSVITVTQSYFPAVEKSPVATPARVAMYAQNSDYHFWLKDKLNAGIHLLKEKYPHEVFAAYVDSGPVLEKDFAYQAGHGWFGKNSCLIHPKKGSLFFVAEILTSLSCESSLKPLPDMCGTCTRCMDVCPTQAIVEPKVIQADRCISYLTIESKTTPPLELRSQIKDWFFGCDLCQTVCPWNEKVFRTQKIQPSHLTSTRDFLDLDETERQELTAFYKMILTSSNKKIQKHFYGTPLSRPHGFGLKRNALIVVANRKMTALKSEVQSLCKDDKLGELAEWALKALNL